LAQQIKFECNLKEEKKMERRAILPTYGPPSKKTSIAWLVLLICTIGAVLIAVMVAAQDASAQDDPDPSAGWFQRCTSVFPKDSNGIESRPFDPIRFPGTPEPVGHRHLFVGATNISPTSTADYLQLGGSTCAFQVDSNAAKVFGDKVIGGNYSSYWAPDLMLRDSTPDNPHWAGVKQFNAYYKKGASSIDRQTVKRFPSGLKMIIRDDNTSKTNVKWYCAGLNNGSNGIYRERPYDCNTTPETSGGHPWVTTRITFPQCGTGALDGRPDDPNTPNIDESEHISHMAYAGDNGCPKDHPLVFPRLILTVKYDTSLGANSQLAIYRGDDPVQKEDPSMADPGMGFHADYFEAWKTDAAFKDTYPTKGTADSLQFFVDHCIKAGINCRDGDMLPQ
jgi:hypothetical protein